MNNITAKLASEEYQLVDKTSLRTKSNVWGDQKTLLSVSANTQRNGGKKTVVAQL